MPQPKPYRDQSEQDRAEARMERMVEERRAERKHALRDSSSWDAEFQQLTTGELAVLTGGPQPEPSPENVFTHTVPAGHAFPPDSILRSPSGRFKLAFQGDGNVVFYEDDKPLSATLTPGSGRSYVFQTDGNLVIYAAGRPIANTATQDQRGRELAVENDGNVVIYAADHRPIWSRRDERGNQAFLKDLYSIPARLRRRLPSI